MKIKKICLVLWLIALFIVLSHSLYAYVNQRGIVNSIYVILSFLPYLYILMNRVKITSKKRMLQLLFFYFGITLYYFLLKVSSDNYISFICRYWMFIPGMILVFCDLLNRQMEYIVFKYISDIMLAISIFSLFFWLLGTTFGLISPSFSIYMNWGNDYRQLYYGLYLEVPGSLFGTSLQRNCGIFCEAPAFAFFLGVAYCYDSIINKTKNIKRTIVFLIALMTTGTTTGILIILYAFISSMWIKTSKRTIKSIFIRFLTILVGTIGIFMMLRVMFMDSKIASVLLRQSDYINGFSAWLKKPITGYGYMLNTSLRVSTGFSNGIMQILVAGGVLLFSVYLIPFLYTLFISFKINRKELFWGTIFFGIMFAISIIGYAYITLLILAFGYAFMIYGRLNEKDGMI